MSGLDDRQVPRISVSLEFRMTASAEDGLAATLV